MPHSCGLVESRTQIHSLAIARDRPYHHGCPTAEIAANLRARPHGRTTPHRALDAGGRRLLRGCRPLVRSVGCRNGLAPRPGGRRANGADRGRCLCPPGCSIRRRREGFSSRFPRARRPPTRKRARRRGRAPRGSWVSLPRPGRSLCEWSGPRNSLEASEPLVREAG